MLVFPHCEWSDARGKVSVIYQYRLYEDGHSAFPYASPGMESIYEVTPEEVREDATPVYGRLHPDDNDDVVSAIQESADTLNTFYCEFRVNLPRQGLRWRWSQAYPTRLPDNSTLWHGIILDVTDRKLLENQLRQTQKLEAIGTLAGGIAHDFNNILFAIMGNADLARGTIPEGNPAFENVQAIMTAGKRAAELVKQILTFARRSEKRRDTIEITTIVKEVSILLRATLPTTISINLRIDTDQTSVFADPTEIHQVIMNLCTNAGQAMGESGGKLEIALSSIDADAHLIEQHPGLQAQQYLVLTVSDTGPGIPADVQPRIFEPFYTTKSHGEGTGMGLAVVHGIVKDLGGAINVYSEVGQGTVFRAYLPLAGNVADQAEGEVGEIPGGLERILVVDDEPALATMLQNMLKSLGYTVEAFSSSEQALAEFRARPDHFDVVVTDQTMPELTGAELAARILAEHPAQPIILCTGFSQTMTQEKAKQLGIAAFVSKPVSIKDLAVAIRQVLDGHAASPKS